jgi:Zn finger protein HypA/HybF involved in hydrogenase expression
MSAANGAAGEGRSCDPHPTLSQRERDLWISLMHELSIAVSIIDLAGEEAARNNATRVHSVRLRLGLRAGVAKEALQFSYGIACEGTPLEGSRLLIDDAEGTDLEVVSLEIER